MLVSDEGQWISIGRRARDGTRKYALPKRVMVTRLEHARRNGLDIGVVDATRRLGELGLRAAPLPGADDRTVVS
jgi:hypothetical protein